MDEHDGFKLQERGVHRQMVRLGLQHDMGSGTSAAQELHRRFGAEPPKPVLKRDRTAIIRMVERTFATFNTEEAAKLLAERCIRKTFAQAGQDPWAADTAAFKKHLDSLESNPAYGVLLPKQVRHNIEDQVLANQMALLQL